MSRHRRPSAYLGYHLSVGLLLAGVVLASCAEDKDEFTERLEAADVVPDVFTATEARAMAERNCQDYQDGLNVGAVLADLDDFTYMSSHQIGEFVRATLTSVCSPSQQAAARDNQMTP